MFKSYREKYPSTCRLFEYKNAINNVWINNARARDAPPTGAMGLRVEIVVVVYATEVFSRTCTPTAHQQIGCVGVRVGRVFFFVLNRVRYFRRRRPRPSLCQLNI